MSETSPLVDERIQVYSTSRQYGYRLRNMNTRDVTSKSVRGKKCGIKSLSLVCPKKKLFDTICFLRPAKAYNRETTQVLKKKSCAPK